VIVGLLALGILGVLVFGLFFGPPIVLATRPVLRRLAIRNALRRPRESALVVLGSLLATALITAAFVVGDTFNSSIRGFAHTQLGPVDEVVSVVGLGEAPALRAALDGFEHPDADGVLEITTTGVAAATLEGSKARTAAPKAQLIETDFAAARDFGGDPGSTGISGATPDPGTAAIVDDLADKLEIGPGDRFTAFVAGASVDLVVDRILPQRGVAGYWRGPESSSYNAFVAPGTIAELAAAATGDGEPPTFAIAVSNRGGVESGAQRSEAVARALRDRLDGVTAKVDTVKADLIENADEAGASLTQLYQGIGAFAVIAGILLMVNIFLMLSQERKPELGMMRAMGLRRSSLIAGFASEGWLYAVLASALGVFAGLGIARVVMVGAARIFSSGEDEFSFPLKFAAKPASLVIGFVVGLGIAMLTVLGTSIGTAFFNVIAAIRGIDDQRQQRFRRVRMITGGFRFLLGIAIGMAGLQSPAASPIIAGFAISAWGLYGVVRARVGPKRKWVTVFGGFALVWGVVAVPVAVAREAELDIDAFVTQGLTLVLASVALVTEYQHEIGRLLSRLTGRSLTVRLGLAYPLARRQRTAFTIGQFSIVVFVLVYISVLSHMFGGQVEEFTAEISGGYNALVESNPANPIPFDELATRNGVSKVAPLTRIAAEITPEGEKDSTAWFMSGFDERFVEGGPPRLEALGEYADDEEAYRAVLEHGDYAMVDSFFLSDAGPPSAAVEIGDTITIEDPVSGRSKDLLVVAEAPDDWLFNGGLVSSATLREVFGDRAVPSRAYVSADDPGSFTAAVEADYFERGAEAETLAQIVDRNLTQQNQFFTLMRGFLAVGLVIGIAGIGVIMVRAVRERRRQIGVLRALGFEAESVSGAFAIEAGFIAIEGTIIGVLLGFVCTWSITLTDDFGEGLRWGVPWLSVVVLVVGTLVGALLATFAPARSASHIRPSVALRMTD